MIVYQYNHVGLYQGETVADESPEEPGIWLYPARTTAIPPPSEWPEDRWPRFNGVGWDLVNKPQPIQQTEDPVQKLQAFLQANPEVAALLS